MTSNERNHDQQEGACPEDAVLKKYLAGTLDDAAKSRIETHIRGCSECADFLLELTMIIETTFAPQTEEEKEELAFLDQLTPAEQAEKLLEYQQAERRWVYKPGAFFAHLRRVLFAGGVSPFKVRPENQRRLNFSWKGALAATTLIVIFLAAARYGLREWQASRWIRTASEIMSETYFISKYQAARPTGGFAPTSLGGELGSTRRAVQSEIESRLEQILSRKPHSAKAQQLLGTYYLLHKNDPATARRYYSRAAESDSSAAILNDLGAAFFYEHDYDIARQYFERALQKQPEFPEATYNLGLVYLQQQEWQKARSLFEAYLRLYPNPESDWPEIVAEYLRKVKSK